MKINLTANARLGLGGVARLAGTCPTVGVRLAPASASGMAPWSARTPVIEAIAYGTTHGQSADLPTTRKRDDFVRPGIRTTSPPV